MTAGSALALALALAWPTLAGADGPPRVFVGAPGAEFGRTRVLVFEPDGVFASVSSLPLRHGARLDTKHGYQNDCGRWREGPPGTVTVVARLMESFSYAAPPDAGRPRTEVFRVEGAGSLAAPGARLRGGSYSFLQTAPPSLNPGELSGFSAFCRRPDVLRPARP